MAKYILKRILQALPLLLIITILCFALMNLAPYDAIDSYVTPMMSPEQVAQIKARYGFDQPVPIQYLKWLGNILQGDFGNSIITKQKISLDLMTRIPNTVRLVLPSYLTAFLLAIVLGLIAGMHKGKWLDRLIDGFCSVGIAIPSFWLALILIYVFAFRLQIFPIMGMQTIGKEGSLTDYLAHFSLPYITLTIAFLPDLIRYVRSSTIGQLSEDYVMVQRAFGASRFEILFRHVAKNVLLPIITKLGMALPMLVTGAIITESVFVWPGIGPYFVTGIRSFDYPIVMAILLLSATLVILGNLLSDILYSITDPRIRGVR